MVPLTHRVIRLAPLFLSLLPLAGCLFHSHNVELRMTTAHMRDASKEELLASISREAEAINTLNATVDISPAIGGSKKGVVTEYTDIRGYILVRKPAMLRMIGLVPVVRNRAFDMVSDGTTFRVSLPSKNKFVVGRNNVSYPSQQGFAALRPQDIFDALLLKPVDRENEIAVLENATEPVLDPKSKKQVLVPNYILTIVQKNAKGEWLLDRKIYFDRENLQVDREMLFDETGSLETDAHYERYTDYGGILFPARVDIDRPQEEYSIVLNIVKLAFNEQLSDEQFALEQPPGSQLIRLDEPPKTPAASVQTPPSAAHQE